MTPRPPALDTAAARRPPEVRAMPARMIGCLMPRRVVRGVVIGPVGEDILGGETVSERWDEVRVGRR